MGAQEDEGLRNPFKTIIVTGIPGVGKTTVLKKIDALLEDKAHLIVNFGDFMYEAARREGLVSSRDEIRRISHRKQLQLQKIAASLIVSKGRNELEGNGILLVDTHAVVKTASGYWPGLPKHVIEALKPDSIVVIEADPSEIISRQQQDSSRYRKDLSNEETIRMLMQMARIAAMSSAVITASSVYIVENPSGKPEEAAISIIELINKL